MCHSVMLQAVYFQERALPVRPGTDASYTNRFRSLDGGMCIASRYLATVRLATLIPWSPSMAAILLSLNGFFGVSVAISFLIIARIAVDEHSPPSSVLTWLEKKYLSSNMPRGVCMYFWVVTLEMVD